MFGEPWWGCGFIFFCLRGGSQTTTPGSATWLKTLGFSKVLLCSLFDLLWEVLGAEKVLRRDVEEEEGPVTWIETKVVEGQSHHPWKYAALEISDWVLEGGFNEGWLRGFVVIFLYSAFWEFSEFPWQDFLLFYPNKDFLHSPPPFCSPQALHHLRKSGRFSNWGNSYDAAFAFPNGHHHGFWNVARQDESQRLWQWTSTFFIACCHYFVLPPFFGKKWLERLVFTFFYLIAYFNLFATENSRCLIRKGSSKAAKTWAFLYSLFTCSTGARLSRAKETAASHLYWKKVFPPFSVRNPSMWMLMWMLMAYTWNICDGHGSG